jgi:hypothetical protein
MTDFMSMIPGALAVLVVGTTAVIAASPDGPKTTIAKPTLADLVPSVLRSASTSGIQGSVASSNGIMGRIGSLFQRPFAGTQYGTRPQVPQYGSRPQIPLQTPRYAETRKSWW